MQYVISTSQLLANVLRTRESVSTYALHRLACFVQGALTFDLPGKSDIDTSQAGLSVALEDSPSMFRRYDYETVGRPTYEIPGSFGKEHINLYFNDQIPEEIRSKFLHYLAQAIWIMKGLE